MIHRRSKISRLPEAAITHINESLDANVEYARILDWLREQGHHDLEHYHVSRWRETGYQDWLHAQEHQAALDRQLQWAGTYAAQETHARLHNAAMNLIIFKLFDAINRFDSAEISHLLENKPEKILTLINTFSRYSHAFVATDRLKEDLRVNALAEHRIKAPKERLPDELRRKIREELRLALQIPASAIPAQAPEPLTTAQNSG
jgi:hypothetical protein